MMRPTTQDPRAIRTRKLLIDAFMEATQKTAIKEITVKDITDKAKVNRATFYAHFLDKEDLMDTVISESIITSIVQEIKQLERLDEKSIITVFSSLSAFQRRLHAQLNSPCRRALGSLHAGIDAKIKQELEKRFEILLMEEDANIDEDDARIGAAMLSWAMYGASVDLYQRADFSPEEYIQRMLPFIGEAAKALY